MNSIVANITHQIEFLYKNEHDQKTCIVKLNWLSENTSYIYNLHRTIELYNSDCVFLIDKRKFVGIKNFLPGSFMAKNPRISTLRLTL